jgi:hypothetical protein
LALALFCHGVPQIMFMAEILAFLLAYYSFVIATGFASA